MEVTNDMLVAAMKEAVKQGLVETHTSQEKYIENYDKLKKVLKAALQETEG